MCVSTAVDALQQLVGEVVEEVREQKETSECDAPNAIESTFGLVGEQIIDSTVPCQCGSLTCG